MDMYFYYNTITDVNLYNCSALTEEEKFAMNVIRRPLQGISAIIFGFVMMIIYILCLLVMLQPSFFEKACYKIMFFLGLYDLLGLIGSSGVQSYSLIFGISFCDSPNLYYFLGCLHMMCWSGPSYFCLYLSFNRIIELLEFKRDTIEFFFSPARTALGCLSGILYSLYFFFFTTPIIYSNTEGTLVPDPLNLISKVEFNIRLNFLMFNNYGLILVTFTLYGLFSVLFYNSVSRLLDTVANRIRLQNQVFIQVSLVCAITLVYALSYSFYIFFPNLTFLPKMVFTAYQYTIGLQALIYLFCNQTIRDSVKELILRMAGIKVNNTIDVSTDNANSEVKNFHSVAVVSSQSGPSTIFQNLQL